MKALEKIQKIDINSSEFPDKLKNIHDPPRQLYAVGNTELLKSLSVGVVGSRRNTVYGKNVALMVGRRLAECGIPVVSGLAYGIDSYSHQGTVEAGGKMIAVLASGIRRMGPRKNYSLMMDGLEKGGLVVSEYEPDMDAKKYTFPARNRIISGLSDSVVVIEANYNSGALITAQYALDQGRIVYAVPGNINSQFSLGSNLLIRDGAYPLVIIDDLVRNLGMEPAAQPGQSVELGEDEKPIYEAVIKHEGISPDLIAEELHRTIGFVNAIVTVMEIKGIVRTHGGKIYLAN